MGEIRMEAETTEQSCSGDSCPNCEKAAHEARNNEEMAFAFLLALVPVISLTFFGQIGLL